VRDLAHIILEQQTAGFPAFTGSHLAAFIPVSATFLNRLAAESLPQDAPICDIHIEPDEGNVVRIRGRLTRLPFIPPLTITLSIERQPQFPDSPTLVLRLTSSALAMLAGVASRFLGALPNGLRLERELLFVDLAELLRQRGMAEWLQHVDSVEVTTAPGAVLLSIRAAVGPR
jgi:hypothetical protein